jgi:hypothetical protein
MQRYSLKDIMEAIWGALLIGVTIVFSPILRHWYNRWGATEYEVARPMPGDLLIPRPRLTYTRAIAINAPAKSVWPWLVQIGYGKAGLYSYDLLENLIGCRIYSQDRIIPDFQNLKVGDFVGLGPPGYPRYRVEAVEPNRLLMWAGADPKTGHVPEIEEAGQHSYVNARWVFMLEEHTSGMTRLIVRSRMDYYPSRLNWLIWRVLSEPMNFVMEHKMLKGIKFRAETLVRHGRIYTTAAI